MSQAFSLEDKMTSNPGRCPGLSCFTLSASRQGGTTMPIPESEVSWVEEAKLGLWEQLYIPALIGGLKTTLGHMVKPKITEQYPEQEPKMPANYRGVHRLNRDANGRVKCVACY